MNEATKVSRTVPVKPYIVKDADGYVIGKVKSRTARGAIEALTPVYTAKPMTVAELLACDPTEIVDPSADADAE